ncbi:MAG: glycosyltransferase [Anaerolineales bacterium]|nr:MAG: glycosyltransferase [Anaerolineales bacterium]
MTKVCMLVLHDITYDSRVKREAKTLSQAGYRVKILDWEYPRGSGDGQITQREGLNGVEVSRVRILTRDLPKNSFFRGIKYLEYIGSACLQAVRERADVYHAHDLNTLLPALIAARINKAKIVYDSHELWIELYPRCAVAWQKRVWQTLERWCIKRVDRVIGINASIAAYMAQLYDVPTPTVVRNCCEYVEVEKGENLLRETLHIENGTKIVLFIGGITANKGIEEGIKAMGHIDNCVFVIMGFDHGFREQFRQLARDVGVENRVKFAPPVPPDQVVRWAASADIGLVCIRGKGLSYYYSVAQKLWECLMAELPVVVNDLPEMRQLVEHYQVGLVIEQEMRPEAIAAAIRKLIGEERLYRRLQKNTQRLKRECNWENEAAKLLEVYRGLDQQVQQLKERIEKH